MKSIGTLIDPPGGIAGSGLATVPTEKGAYAPDPIVTESTVSVDGEVFSNDTVS